MNPNQKKNIIYSLLLVAAIFAVWKYRQYQENRQAAKIEIRGETMGTTYTIKYLDPQKRNFKPSVDSLLQVFNQSLSTYIPDSELSTFNKLTLYKFNLPFFPDVLYASKRIWEETDGAFDPTVGPLVNAWGFGPEGRQNPDSSTVMSLMERVGFDKIFFDEESVCKLSEGIYLDFSAIAKGQGVDVVAEMLEAKGIANYLVEIGGEIRAKGNNDEGNIWQVYIEKPTLDTESRTGQAVLKLNNVSLATSGNYRNYYEQDGKIIAHTIDPKTGYPAGQNLLSVSVTAKTCMEADAYATAFMVMGFEAAKTLCESLPDIDAYFIYADGTSIKTYATPGIKSQLTEID
jgi:thiamine biosynthesis lipoprotein